MTEVADPEERANMQNQKAQPLMGLDEVAEYLGVPARTLYSWRTTGKGPRGYRVGKYVRYRQTDVDAWLEKQADPIPAA